MPTGETGKWGFPRDSGDAGPHYTKEGVRANVVTFTNTASSSPPTGIAMDDLPYIVLVGMALVSLASFVVIKSRRNAKNVA